ncbi:MAG: cytochrome c biogenesis protein CcsA [Myxococcota bacterium]
MNLVLALRTVAVLYVLVAVASVIHLVRPARLAARTIAAALGATACAHLVVLVARGVQAGGLPITNLHDDFSMFSFVAASLSSILALRTKVQQVAPLSALLIAALMMAVFTAEPTESVPATLRSGWLPVHIACAFLGNALFLMAGLVSIVFLVQERRLKGKKARWVPSGPDRLPPLETLDQVSVRLIQMGFPLLTIGLMTGALYGREFWGTYWIWDARNTLSLLIWLLYALLLHFRITIGWRGRRLALLTLAGVVATLVSMVGLNLAQVGTHGKDFLL